MLFPEVMVMVMTVVMMTILLSAAVEPPLASLRTLKPLEPVQAQLWLTLAAAMPSFAISQPPVSCC